MSAELLHFPAPADAPSPSNIEAEAALLGALLLDSRLIDKAAEIVTPEDFAEPLFGRVFAACLSEHGQGRTPNAVTLRPLFVDDPAAKQMGGPAFLASLSGSGAALFAAGDFARQIADLAKRRRLRQALNDAAVAVTGCEQSLDEVTGELEAALLDVSGTRDGMVELSGAGCISKALALIDQSDRGVTSGLEAVDNAMGPIRRKALAIVAARPGMGKSALAVSYALGAAHKGHGVLIVSLEMSAEDIGERMVCDLCFDSTEQVPYAALVNGELTRNQIHSAMQASEALADIPIQIIDTTALSVGKLSAIVRRWKRRFAARGQSLDLVIVDYLQLLRAPGSSGRYEQITEISQTLKEIAKANDLGVMALSQLSRKVEERTDKRPMLSDLRESGQIEQDADAVLFLLRQEYYLGKAEPDKHSPDRFAWEDAMRAQQGKIEFICAKRRKGREQTTEGRFYGQFQAVRG